MGAEMRSQGPAVVMIRGIQWVLVLGALALCIRALAFVATPEGDAPEPTAEEASKKVPDASLPPARFAVIAGRDLFRRKVEEPVLPVAPPIVESTLNVELLGTLVASRAEQMTSFAVVRDLDGRVVTLAKGDLFADERAKLMEIEPRQIVLEQSGRLETVMLEQKAAAATTAPRSVYNTPRDRASVAAAAKAEEIARMQREVQRRMQEAMPEVGAVEPASGRN